MSRKVLHRPSQFLHNSTISSYKVKYMKKEIFRDIQKYSKIYEDEEKTGTSFHFLKKNLL